MDVCDRFAVIFHGRVADVAEKENVSIQDLANLINEAAIIEARANKKTIGMEELEEAIARVIAGPERKSRRISDHEKEVIAYHETGHALGLPHTARFADIMYSFQYGGDITEYFNRYRRLLTIRGDIRRHSGMSDADRKRLAEVLGADRVKP